MKDIETLEKKLATIEDAISEFKEALVEAKKDPQKDPDPPKDWKFNSLTETEKKMIESVMRHFNFEKVHGVMTDLDWKWVTIGGAAVPSIEELKSEAKRLLVNACTDKTCWATGGLKAIYERDGEFDDDPYVGLEFILEEIEGFTNDEDDEDDEDDWEDRI